MEIRGEKFLRELKGENGGMDAVKINYTHV